MSILYLTLSPYNYLGVLYCIADVRRLFLAEGQQLAVVVRGGEGYILKVELTKVLPAHSRDVLESIRRVSVYYFKHKVLSIQGHD